MEKIICESVYFYGSCEDTPETFRIMFRLKDMINGSLLQQAAEQAMRRYPYYSVCCILKEEEYMLQSNNKPFLIKNTYDSIILGGEENNDYLVAISYWHDKVWINMFHGLTDAYGTMRFARTMLFYYCCKKYDPLLSSNGILVNDNKIPLVEWENPYIDIMSGKRKLPSDEDIVVRLKENNLGTPFSIFDDHRITYGNRKHYQIRIPEKQIIQYCRTYDGTPTVIFSILMSRAVDKLNPENDLPIIAGVAVNLRPALMAPMYKGSPIGMIYLPYEGKLKNKCFAKQTTIFRGKLLLMSDYDRLLSVVNNSKRLYSAIDDTPSLKGKKDIMHTVFNRYKNASTFQISYVGQANLGAVEQYICEMELENASEGLMIELVAVNGYFYLDFMQQWQEDIYFDAFCKELIEQGFSYELLNCEEQIITKISLQ